MRASAQFALAIDDAMRGNIRLTEGLVKCPTDHARRAEREVVGNVSVSRDAPVRYKTGDFENVSAVVTLRFFHVSKIAVFSEERRVKSSEPRPQTALLSTLHSLLSTKKNMPTLIEIKARSRNANTVRDILRKKNADFKGIDRQVDTYFRVPHGRLKLREGNIENHLIHYFRKNQSGPKKSEVLLYKSTPGSGLKAILETSVGVLTVVDKEREIYFIDNVKFHIDRVQGLGNFIEIEAIDKDGSIPEADLLRQCEFYIDLFGVKKSDLLEDSYSDMILRKQPEP